MKRIFLVLLFCAMTLPGCGKNELLNEMSGVWRANDKTLITLNYADKKFHFAANNDALDAELGVVDEKNKTVSLVMNLSTGKQTWTFRHEIDKENKTPHLVFTGHDGTQDILSFVRKITPADLEKFASTELLQPVKPVAQAASEAESREQAFVEADFVDKEDICAGLDLTVTEEMFECSVRKGKIADRELDAMYKKLEARLDETRRQQLKKSQIAWIKQKEATCDQAGKELEGGTLQLVTINDCYAQETEKRVAHLKGLK